MSCTHERYEVRDTSKVGETLTGWILFPSRIKDVPYDVWKLLPPLWASEKG